jgi:perosamine synthetase
MFQDIVDFIREIYRTDSFIPLHEPRFLGNEKKYVNECIDSTFVSSVGKFVDLFEEKFAAFVGAKYAVAVVNGTQALFMALKVAGVQNGEEVLTQSLTFVATANAISYLDASPVFLDVDIETLGLSPQALLSFLEKNSYQQDGQTFNKTTRKRIAACVPMHTFGHPCMIAEIQKICQAYHIPVVEDAAESLGSTYQAKHTGTFGALGVFSFNGNKIITTGGGGMLVTDDEAIAKRAKHLTTTAKIPHAWEFNHDEIGYNFRMPNLNAALGVAQIIQLPEFLENKRELAQIYDKYFAELGITFIKESKKARSNYWMNAILLDNRQQRDDFLKYTNDKGVMTRCLWTPMHQLSMYQGCQRGPLENTLYLYERVVNIPSSVLL